MANDYPSVDNSAAAAKGREAANAKNDELTEAYTLFEKSQAAYDEVNAEKDRLFKEAEEAKEAHNDATIEGTKTQLAMDTLDLKYKQAKSDHALHMSEDTSAVVAQVQEQCQDADHSHVQPEEQPADAEAAPLTETQGD